MFIVSNGKVKPVHGHLHPAFSISGSFKHLFAFFSSSSTTRRMADVVGNLGERISHDMTILMSYRLDIMSCVMRKPDFGLCENKGADQLCSNCTADQRLCFRLTDSTISLLPKSEISSS